MKDRKASIKETGEELSAEEWARFEAAVGSDQRAARGERTLAEVSPDDDQPSPRLPNS
jgi:hypothetical protein